MRTKAYDAWRESESYQVPMTDEGVKRAQDRWRGFDKGYKQAVKDVVGLLMIQHEAAKGSHNYWQAAANLIQADVESNERIHEGFWVNLRGEE